MKFLSRRELTERQYKLLRTNIFIGKMLSIGVVFHLILWMYPDTYRLQTAYAEFITQIMNIAGYDFRARSVYILPGYEITQDCLGWKSVMAYAALIISSTKKMKPNLKYIFGGIGLILIANVLRIITTIHLTEVGIISFEIIHGFLWKWSLTAIVLVIWIYWFRNHRDQ